MLGELGHETLAKTHDLAIGFALGIKVRTAFCAAHGKRCQAVFENLLESEEFNDAEIDGRMQPDAAFIRPDRGIELHAESPVDLHFAVIVHPGHPEHDLPFGFDQSFQYARIHEILSFFHYGFEGHENFGYCLNKLGLALISLFHSCQKLFKVSVFDCHM